LIKRYCNCDSCIRGEVIVNPHKPYEREVEMRDLRLVFDGRTSLLCRIGCGKYGKKPTCPPNIPTSDYYQRIFDDYSKIFVIGRKYPYSDGMFQSHWRTYSTNEVHDLLLQKERHLFEQGHMYAKAFIGGSCKICPNESCSKHVCRIPHYGRVPLEATGINVYELFKSLGLSYQEPPIDYFWRVGIVLAN